MIRAAVLQLIAEAPEARGVFDDATETARQVFCDVRSVTRAEFYRAKEIGVEPTFIFVLSNFAEYNGEKIAVYEGARYRIVRTYVNGESIELTAEVDIYG